MYLMMLMTACRSYSESLIVIDLSDTASILTAAVFDKNYL